MNHSSRTRTVLLLVMLALLTACSSRSVPPAPAAVQPTTAPSPTATATPHPTATTTPSPTPTPTATPFPTATPQPIVDPLTGAPALGRGTATTRPYIVMIDNHPDAYPQTGLDHAAVVVEALAEYGITRFMAVYVPGITPEADAIGPVRSTRTYFVQWAMGFHALYAHAGGSPEGLRLAESTDQLINLDALQKKAQPYFARIRSRAAPHNLYTSSADLERALADFGGTDFADPTLGFVFKEDNTPDQRPASQRLSYYFLYKQFPVGWIYDPENNGYWRLWRGRPAVDGATGEQLWMKNVVVIEVAERRIPGDDKARIEQDVIGEGRGRLFMDGVEIEITWHKNAPEEPLQFFDGDQEVSFNAGPIWIAAIPSLDNLTVQ